MGSKAVRFRTGPESFGSALGFKDYFSVEGHLCPPIIYVLKPHVMVRSVCHLTSDLPASLQSFLMSLKKLVLETKSWGVCCHELEELRIVYADLWVFKYQLNTRDGFDLGVTRFYFAAFISFSPFLIIKIFF